MDGMNSVRLSDDRRQMTIQSPDGRRVAHLRSARPGGFTTEEAFKALNFEFSIEQPNERTVAWRKQIVGRWYLTVSMVVGPPTWWLPKVRVGRVMMAGWLRTMVKWSISKEDKQ
jgi:hypothetical protein